MNRKYVIALIVLVVIIGACAFIFNNLNQSSNGASINIDANALEQRGNLVVNNTDESAKNGLYTASTSDLNSILVTNNGKLDLKNSIINKTGDTATSGDDADFYGINSAILVNKNGSAEISDVEINTNSKGSNGIFVTNSESSGSSASPEGGQPPEAAGGNSESVSGETQATVNNVKITTHSDKSRGLDATYNGIINAENVEISTDGQSCAALATDRGEGEVHVKNSNINTGASKTSGRGSPLIYSTGNITVENTEGTSYVSQIACIEGKNSIDVTNSELTGYGEGNREDNGEYVDLGGVFIYQSMSGDADVGTSTFNAVNSKLSISEDSKYYATAPMFHITNTACVINLENSEVNFGSGIFLDASGQNQWGSEGSNGGDVELNTENMDINGNVNIDSISSISWTMTNTDFKGVINASGNANITVGSGSSWTLTGDSSVSNLEVDGEIDYGSYTLKVNGVEYSSSNPF